MLIIHDQDAIKVDIFQQIQSNPKSKALLKKKTLKASMDPGGEFSSLFKVDTYNAKLKLATQSPQRILKDKTKGIVTQLPAMSNAEFLDDSDLQAILNPKDFQEESTHYMSIRTLEKMIVNQMQCFINTGIKVLVEYIRQQILETYIKIEKKFKFKNKGLLYLLQLYDKDVTKMLQYYN